MSHTGDGWGRGMFLLVTGKYVEGNQVRGKKQLLYFIILLTPK